MPISYRNFDFLSTLAGVYFNDLTNVVSTHVLAPAVGDDGGARHDGLQLGDGPAHVPLEAVHAVPEV